MTAYALTHSTSWSAGIVGAPVTDWRDYDSIYTERLMKLPKNNPDGYRRTAPRFAADRLNARMLLIHGTMDDNVHMQNSVQFAYELQKAGKPFEMMVYAEAATRLQRSSLDYASPSDDVRLRHARDGAGHSGGTVVARVMLPNALGGEDAVVAVELRPPRAELGSVEGMDAWIDSYHEIRRLGRHRIPAFLTDSAVGTPEENNLRHLSANLGRELPRDLVTPFLTSKHSLDFCLSYAEQAWQQGFSSLVVLGGDTSVGHPRCVEHAWDLRRLIREREPRLSLGGWANPHASASKQVDFLLDSRFCAEFYLTQVVSHLNLEPVKRFLDEVERRHVPLPGMFSVFYYRSASPKTLATLNRFMPVPIEGLVEEFGSRLSAVDVCARTLKAVRALGVRHFCICNLPMQDSWSTLSAILEKANS